MRVWGLKELAEVGSQRALSMLPTSSWRELREHLRTASAGNSWLTADGSFGFQRLLLLSALRESFSWPSLGWELLQPLSPADSCAGEVMHCSTGCGRAQLQPVASRGSAYSSTWMCSGPEILLQAV